MKKRVFTFVLVAALVLGNLIGILGISYIPMVLVTALLFVIVSRPKIGGMGAVSTVLIAFVWLIVLLYFLSGASHLSINLLLPISLWIVSALILVGLFRGTLFEKLAPGSALVLDASMFVVPLVWVIAASISLFGFGDVGAAWAMSGDSATFLTQARDLINPGTVEIWHNVVPVAAAISSIFMLAAHTNDVTQSVLESDVLGLAGTWIFVFACISWLTAALVVSLIKLNTQVNKWILALAGLGGSLIPFTWFYSGYALSFGFLGASFALLIVFAALLVFLQKEIPPSLKVGVFLFSASAAFFAWTPFVLVPLILIATELPTLWRSKASISPFEIGFIVVGFLQFVLVFVLQLLPFFLATQQSNLPGGTVLALNGAAVYFRPLFVGGIFVLAVGAFVLGLLKRHKKIFITFVAMELLLGLAFGYLVIASKQIEFPWLYYPSKFIWLVMLILLPLSIGSLLLWALRVKLFSRSQFRQVLVVVLVFVVVMVSLRATSAWGHVNAGLQRPDAFSEVIQSRAESSIDQVPNREVAKSIFELENREQLRILWDSDYPNEDQINFWMLKMWSISDHGPLMLGDFIYGTKPKTIDSLCEILIQVGTPIEIITANKNLQKDLLQSCPEVNPDIILQ